MKSIILNQQYLSFENPATRVLIVQSGKGTGKTRWLQENVSEEPALFITHRIALGRDIATRNKSAFYKDGGVAYQSPRLVISVDSLHNLFNSEVHHGATIILDEATQVLRHLKGETCRNYRKEIYWTLNQKIYHCKQLILLDADMNQETVDFFVGLMNWGGEKVTSEDITWVKNEYSSKNRIFREFPSADALTLDLINSVREGKNIYVACDTKGQVNLVEAILRKNTPDVRMLTVTSDDSRNQEQAEFINNPNEAQKQYQVVAASPSLATGVDVSEEHFDLVYLFGNGYASGATDLLQATARVRNPKDREVRFWVSPNLRYEEENWEEILKGIVRRRFGFPSIPQSMKDKDIWEAHLGLDYNPVSNEIKVSDKNYIEMFCKVTALENESLNNLHDSFIDKVKKEGKLVKVHLTKSQEKVIERAKEATKELKKSIKREQQLAILNAEAIAEDDVLLLLKEEDLSQEEALKVKRYKLLDRVGGIEEFLPLIVENENKIFRATYLWSLLRGDVEELELKDQKDKIKKFATDVSYRVKTKQLLEDFLDVINFKNSFELGETLNCDHKPYLFGNLANWFTTRRVEFEDYLGVKVPADIQEKPMQFVQTLLGLLGLKANSRQRRVNGERVREYYIDTESVEIMNSIMEANEANKQRRLEKQREEMAAMPF
ncbi:plasmid replication protein, CyRepA1 family [Aliinostoc sp. HNIBRCY26]|uniref:plasmid replication protein, CyRepA1 family n=1 Tax=Aliinostoc sp. HNIBRCY26 TaxID=3418997 RepID=UPI003D023CC2